MKLTKEQLEEKTQQRRLGYPQNGDEENNKTTWEQWEGLRILMAKATAMKNPSLLLQIATGAVKITDLGIDIAKETPLPPVAHPGLLSDNLQALLKEHASVIRDLAQAGSIEACKMVIAIPKTDPSTRLRSITSVISSELGNSGEGCGKPFFIGRVVKQCGSLGAAMSSKLDPESKAAILLGEKVHPLALKHRPAPAAQKAVVQPSAEKK